MREHSSDSLERDFLAQASLDPAAFAWLASRGAWRIAPHLDLLAERLLDIAQGKLKRLLIQMPPRHGKSEFASAHFPAWYLGTFPERRVILASYEHDFAASWGAKARDRFAEYGPALWRLWVRRDKQAADDWQIAGHQGGMVCAGVGGPITGRGANLLVIDDPVKSAEEADSETYRERAWNWYRSTAYTRLEPQGALILIMTRWHEDDLAGRVLAEAAKTGEAWEVINLPALAEEGDVLGRQPGEALWPERYPAQALAEIREAVGPYWWSALYQQRPSPPEGALFRREWWRYWKPDDLPQDFDEVLCSWDMAFKGDDSSDYVVGQVWGRVGATFYLLDQARGHWDFPQTVEEVRRLKERWPRAVLTLIEDKANGPAVVQALRKECAGLLAVDPKGGKFSRAQAAARAVQSGNVHLPFMASWLEDFVHELACFPTGAHDDMVDAASQALLRWLWAQPYPQPQPEVRPDPSLRTVESVIAQRRYYGMFRGEHPDEYGLDD